MIELSHLLFKHCRQDCNNFQVHKVWRIAFKGSYVILFYVRYSCYESMISNEMLRYCYFIMLPASLERPSQYEMLFHLFSLLLATLLSLSRQTEISAPATTVLTQLHVLKILDSCKQLLILLTATAQQRHMPSNKSLKHFLKIINELFSSS